MLQQFREEFRGKVYRHRSSNVGDRLSAKVFEDLYDLNYSPRYNSHVDSERCVLNTRNRITGRPIRRGDGTFGERVTSVPATHAPGWTVSMGPVATIHIGVEVKILATAMIKQIDRVAGDLAKQADDFRSVTSNALTLGIVGVNRASCYTSYEGSRTYDKPENGDKAPIDEASAAIGFLKEHAEPSFDEFLIVNFEATNREPYPFAWTNVAATEASYAAVLQRLLGAYGGRFS